MIDAEARRTAEKFSEERRDMDTRLQQMEERLSAEMKSLRQSAPSSSAVASSSQEANWRPWRIMVKRLEGFKAAECIKESGLVDWDDIGSQNNRMLTTQFVIPLADSCTTKDTCVLKRLIDQWLRGAEEARVHGDILRTVMEAPPSQEARRRAGGRAYGVMASYCARLRRASSPCGRPSSGCSGGHA